jgi:hypothetical protein
MLAFAASMAMLAFDTILFVTLAFSGASKIDPGIATLCGAVVGLSVVAWQARAGFQNLIKSQENQARIEREARLHRSQLDELAEDRKTQRERAILLAALRAETAYLYGAVSEAQSHIAGLITIERALIKRGQPSTNKSLALHSFDAPVFKENISHLGLIGAYLGADVIKVLSRANGKDIKFTLDQPMVHDVVLMIYEGNYSSLQKWASDLYHVAMRILSYENNTADPGTLIETEAKRYAELKKHQV